MHKVLHVACMLQNSTSLLVMVVELCLPQVEVVTEALATVTSYYWGQLSFYHIQRSNPAVLKNPFCTIEEAQADTFTCDTT